MKKILPFLLSLTLLYLASCSTPKRVAYFHKKNGIKDSMYLQQYLISQPEPIIQSDDILAINITTTSSLNEKNTDPAVIYNNGGTPFTTIATSGSSSSGIHNSGFLVDNQGFIDYPIIGKLKVSGLTLRQVKELMTSKLSMRVKDPVVEARIINYKVTVLGEVNKPGFVLAPNQKISLIDAIAAAGDIPISGRKDNVMVIREINGKREYVKLDLNSSAIFYSPYYYLHQNDIIYVEPLRIRKQETNTFFRFYLPAISSLLSAAIAVYGVVQITQK